MAEQETPTPVTWPSETGRLLSVIVRNAVDADGRIRFIEYAAPEDVPALMNIWLANLNRAPAPGSGQDAAALYPARTSRPLNCPDHATPLPTPFTAPFPAFAASASARASSAFRRFSRPSSAFRSSARFSISPARASAVAARSCTCAPAYRLRSTSARSSPVRGSTRPGRWCWVYNRTPLSWGK